MKQFKLSGKHCQVRIVEATSRASLAGLLVACLSCLLATYAAAQDPTCHLLVFADTSDAALRASVGLDADQIKSTFYRNLNEKQLKTSDWTENLSADFILRTIRQTAVRPGVDTLVVYYAGHGAYDPSLGQYLLPQGTTLLRSDIKQAMKSTGARLNVLLTDSCNVILRRPPTTMRKAYARALPQTTPAFQALLWDPAGFADINSSSPGEAAIADDVEGGYFTKSLCSFLSSESQRRLSWDDVVRETKRGVTQRFQQSYPEGLSVSVRGERNFYRSQTVYGQLALSGDGVRTFVARPEVPEPRPRFGVKVNVVNGEVRITGVQPNSPASRVIINATNTQSSLEPGDVILEIDGEHIHSLRDFQQALARARQQMGLIVRDVRSGQHWQMTVNLAN